jgi:hypothetical protein
MGFSVKSRDPPGQVTKNDPELQKLPECICFVFLEFGVIFCNLSWRITAFHGKPHGRPHYRFLPLDSELENRQKGESTLSK